MAKQIQRSRLGPLEIVEQDDHRADVRQPPQHIGHGLEHQVAFGGFVAHDRAGDLNPVGQAWRDPRQLPSAARGVGPEHVGRDVLDEVLEQGAKRRRGHGRAALAESVQHRRRTAVPDGASEPAEQCRLADPCFALQDDCPGPRPAHQRQVRCQPGELAAAPDQSRSPRQLGGERQPSCRAPGVPRRSGVLPGCRLHPVPSRRDPAIEAAHLGRWLGPDRLGQVGPIVPERAQSLGLTPRAGQRLEQQTPRPVPQRMDRDMRLKLGDRLSPPARLDQLDRVVLDRRRVQLGEPDHLRPGPAFGRKFVERRPGPHGQRPFERLNTVITRTNLRKRAV